jgi:hypothetical protein
MINTRFLVVCLWIYMIFLRKDIILSNLATSNTQSREGAKTVRGKTDVLFGYYRTGCSIFPGFDVRG